MKYFLRFLLPNMFVINLDSLFEHYDTVNVMFYFVQRCETQKYGSNNNKFQSVESKNKNL